MSKISQSYHEKTPLFKGLELEIWNRRVRFSHNKILCRNSSIESQKKIVA